MKKSDIRARWEMVTNYLKKGTPEARIAELLGVHRNTVVRDVVHFKKAARGWLDDLARDDFLDSASRSTINQRLDRTFNICDQSVP